MHIGMLPELIEDARRDAADEADIEPLFRSAEGDIRMWERAEARASELDGYRLETMSDRAPRPRGGVGYRAPQPQRGTQPGFF